MKLFKVVFENILGASASKNIGKLCSSLQLILEENNDHNLIWLEIKSDKKLFKTNRSKTILGLSV